MLLVGCVSGEPVPETPGGPSADAIAEAAAPDVLLVVMDTLRPDFLSAYGAPSWTSPHLDGLAARSVLFEDVTSPGSWTWPVHASLFTGEPPWVHGAHRLESGSVDLGSLRVRTLRPEIPTLAEQLSEAGYATRSVSGNGLLRAELGISRGFEQAEIYSDLDDTVVERAQDWMGQTPEQPLFLFVNLLGSHLPYVNYAVPGQEGADLAPLSEGWAAPWVDIHSTGNEALRLNRVAPGDSHGLVLSVARGDRSLTDSELSTLRETYRSEVWATDQRLGRLLQAWDERTGGEGVVVITSDHGEHFGELGLLDHGHVLNGVNTRVPLVIRAPGIAPGRVSQPISQLGVADTVRTLAGIDAETDGLLSLMAEKEGPVATILARSWPDPVWAETVGGEFRYGQRLVRLGDWALVAGEDGSRAVYQTSVDPLMLRDVSGTHGTVLEELAPMLRSMDDVGAGPAPLPPAEPLQEALELLGYVDG